MQLSPSSWISFPQLTPSEGRERHPHPPLTFRCWNWGGQYQHKAQNPVVWGVKNTHQNYLMETWQWLLQEASVFHEKYWDFIKINKIENAPIQQYLKKKSRSKKKPKMEISLTNSKCILNFCPKCNDFPTERWKNNIWIFSKISAWDFFFALSISCS